MVNVEVGVDNHRAIMTHIDLALQELLATTGASRVTLRQEVPGDYAFPVTHEVHVPGAPSLREERTVDLKAQPVVLELQKGRQVVQDDCRAAFDDPAFQRMLEAYGASRRNRDADLQGGEARRDRLAPSAGDAAALDGRRWPPPRRPPTALRAAVRSASAAHNRWHPDLDPSGRRPARS